jgi:hypothetical protein
LSPRANIDINAIRSTNVTRVSFSTDMGGNLSRYRSYLNATAANSPYSLDDSLPTRGATWSLLRYAVDRANATDGFTAGTGQTIVGAGDLVLTTGTTTGEYSITLVNTSFQGGTSTNYVFKSTPSAMDAAIPSATIALSTVPVAVSDDPNALRLDADFEARLRSRERAVLTPLMGAARSWYKSQSMPAPAALESRSAYASTSFAEADAATWFRLVNSTTTGVTNLQSVVGGDLAGFVRDWSVSHAVDDVAALSTQYQQRSWNWHSIYPNITTPTSGYPLQLPLIVAAANLNGTIVAGGAAYFRVAVPPNGTTTLNLSAPTGAVNLNLQLVAVRTK